MVQAILGFFIAIFTARFLGPENYGIVTYASSLTSFVLPIVQLGFTSVLVYEFVNNPHDEGKILGTTILLSVISAFISILGIFTFCMITNAGEKDTIIVCVLYSISLVFQATELIIYWFQAKYLSKYTAIAMFIAYVAMSLYRVFLLITGKSIYWFSVAQSFDYVIVSILLFVVYKKKDGQKLSFSLSIAKRLLRRSKYYILSGIMVTVFAQTGRIILKLMLGNAETGFYSVAVNCAGLLGFVFPAIIDAFRPSVLEKKKISQQEYEKAVINLYAVVFQLALIFSLVLFVFAELVIEVLYGDDYNGAVSILRVIVWYSAFSYFGGAKDVWILAEEKQKYLIVLNAAGAVVNLSLNFLLIPIWGGVGAALASLVTQIFANIIMCIIIKPLRRNAYLFLQSLNPKILINLIKSNLK